MNTFVGFKPCGCAAALYLDDGDRLPDEVVQLLRDGYRVDRVELSAARKLLADCPHKTDVLTEVGRLREKLGAILEYSAENADRCPSCGSTADFACEALWPEKQPNAIGPVAKVESAF